MDWKVVDLTSQLQELPFQSLNDETYDLSGDADVTGSK